MIDASLELKAGDVFTWKNYLLSMNEQKDRIWFLLLGNQPIEALVYEITTTTQLQYYETTGSRHTNNFFKINAGIGGLIADSIVDLTKYFEIVPEKLMNDAKENIQKQGALPKETINTLVRHIKADKDIQGIVKKDIYHYLQETGFTITVK